MESDENIFDNITNSEFENNLSSLSSEKLPNSSENEPQSKKIKTNFDSSENNQKDSYVWLYLQVRNQKTTCKIIIPSKGKEVEYGATYKYDSGTELFEEPIYDENITSDNENSSSIENNFDSSLSVDSIIKTIEN
ncbi:9505_t:CDS:2, partial [Racocetra fulgida]